MLSYKKNDFQDSLYFNRTIADHSFTYQTGISHFENQLNSFHKQQMLRNNQSSNGLSTPHALEIQTPINRKQKVKIKINPQLTEKRSKIANQLYNMIQPSATQYYQKNSSQLLPINKNISQNLMSAFEKNKNYFKQNQQNSLFLNGDGPPVNLHFTQKQSTKESYLEKLRMQSLSCYLTSQQSENHSSINQNQQKLANYSIKSNQNKHSFTLDLQNRTKNSIPPRSQVKNLHQLAKNDEFIFKSFNPFSCFSFNKAKLGITQEQSIVKKLQTAQNGDTESKLQQTSLEIERQSKIQNKDLGQIQQSLHQKRGRISQHKMNTFKQLRSQINKMKKSQNQKDTEYKKKQEIQGINGFLLQFAQNLNMVMSLCDNDGVACANILKTLYGFNQTIESLLFKMSNFVLNKKKKLIFSAFGQLELLPNIDKAYLQSTVDLRCKDDIEGCHNKIIDANISDDDDLDWDLIHQYFYFNKYVEQYIEKQQQILSTKTRNNLIQQLNSVVDQEFNYLRVLLDKGEVQKYQQCKQIFERNLEQIEKKRDVPKVGTISKLQNIEKEYGQLHYVKTDTRLISQTLDEEAQFYSQGKQFQFSDGIQL